MTKSTTGVSPNRGRSVKRDKVRDLYRSDLTLFIEHLLTPFDFGDAYKLTSWHKARLVEIQDSIESQAPRVLYLWARGSLKTCLISRYSNFWRILRDTSMTILVRHGEVRKAEGILANIRTHLLYNPYFREVFPDFCPEKGTKRWGTQDSLDLPNSTNRTPEPNMRAVGIESNLAGDHYKHIHDDDIEHSGNVNTKDTRAKLIRTWEDTPALLCQPPIWKGTHSMVGTPWHAAGLWLGHVIPKFGPESEAPAARKVVYRPYPACTPDLEPLMPEVFSREQLEGLLFDSGPYKFSANYLLKPTDPGTAIFKEEWIQHYDFPSGRDKFNKRWLGDSEVRRVMTVDLAQAVGKQVDCVGYLIVDIDHMGRWFIREAFERRIDSLDLIQLLIRKFQTWGVDTIYVDAVANQAYFSKWAVREAEDQGVRLPVVPVKLDRLGSTAKEQRIMSVATRWANGLCWIVSGAEGGKTLQETMVNYPAVGNDDLLDAMAQLDVMEPKGRERPAAGLPAGSFGWWQRMSREKRPPEVGTWWDDDARRQQIRYIRGAYRK